MATSAKSVAFWILQTFIVGLIEKPVSEYSYNVYNYLHDILIENPAIDQDNVTQVKDTNVTMRETLDRSLLRNSHQPKNEVEVNLTRNVTDDMHSGLTVVYLLIFINVIVFVVLFCYRYNCNIRFTVDTKKRRRKSKKHKGPEIIPIENVPSHSSNSNSDVTTMITI